MAAKKRGAKPHPVTLLVGAALVAAIYGIGFARTREAADRLTHSRARPRPRLTPSEIAEAQPALDMAMRSMRAGSDSQQTASPSVATQAETSRRPQPGNGALSTNAAEASTRTPEVSATGATTSPPSMGGTSGLPSQTTQPNTASRPGTNSAPARAPSEFSKAGEGSVNTGARGTQAPAGGAIASGATAPYATATGATGATAGNATTGSAAAATAAATVASNAPANVAASNSAPPLSGNSAANIGAHASSSAAASSASVAETPTSPPAAAPAIADKLQLPETPAYKDGQYVGWGSCRHGEIQATIVIKGGRIVDSFISGCYTRYTCDWIAKLPPQVVERQSPEVDFVSGASESADAFYYAIVDALKKAK